MPVPSQPQEPQTGVDVVSVGSPLPFETDNEIRLKYVDDQTQGEVVRLDSDLSLFLDQRAPRLFHDRHRHTLPPDQSLLQTRLNQIDEYTKVHQLKIKKDKTKIMSFNFSKKYDFLPKMSIGENKLEVVQSTKLLGVILSSDLKWNQHTEYITKKGKKASLVPPTPEHTGSLQGHTSR